AAAVAVSFTSRWTVSCSCRAAIMQRKRSCTCASWSGQVTVLCGQANQVAACGSHSAGMRYPKAVGILAALIEKPGAQSVIRINAPITQKGPVLTRCSNGGQITGRQEERFLIMRRPCQQLAIRGSHKRRTPKQHISLTSDPVRCCHKDAIGHRMAALHQLPGFVLSVP